MQRKDPCFLVQARAATAGSVKERDALYSELHALGATFRAKHEKLQEHVRHDNECLCSTAPTPAVDWF